MLSVNAMVDRSVLVEALSAALGVTVKFNSDCDDLDEVIQLHITSLTALALLDFKSALAYKPASHFSSFQKLTSLQELETTTSLRFDCDQEKEPKTLKRESASISLREKIFAIPDDFFDPAFDFDFTYYKSNFDSECERGGEPYKRPYGWMRFALKVWDKFPDGNAWLGQGGWRSSSSPGEWPVSYHGTSKQGAEGIIKSHFQAGPRKAYGRGIYSSPDINVAEGYTIGKTFTSSSNGKTYKVIMQNRVNPEKRKIIEQDKSYWLVPIPEGTSPEKEREIVESSIRPYGLLLKEVESTYSYPQF